MKVVILSNRDLKGGGAYLAALRLTTALREEGIDAKMLVKEKQSEMSFVDALTNGHLPNKILAFIKEYGERLFLFTKIREKKDRFNFSLGNWGMSVADHPLVQEADVVHLHWINKSFVSLKEISKISQRKGGFVWTMHDMWSFTGGCHYAANCTNYQNECGNCPMLNSPSEDDLSHQVWMEKRNVYSKNIVEGVTCSSWLEESARQSKLWKTNRIQTINNAIDTDFFTPVKVSVEKNKDRKRRLLFVARDIHDHRKGLDLLQASLDLLVKNRPELKDGMELIIAGDYKKQIEFSVPTTYLGFMNGANDLKKAYLQSDVFVLPSREDNLPNTLVEASACGLASVAYKVGGIAEMIRHEKSGWLVEGENVEALSQALMFFMTCSESDLNQYKSEARQLALEKYSPQAVAKKYSKVYNRLIEKENSSI